MDPRFVRYGIDLGTTNSCVASAEGAEVRVYPNNDQMSVTPSAVRLLKSGRTITGKRAYNAVADDPDNIALEFKRIMGQKALRAFPASGGSMTAEALSAEILKALRDDVARADGEAPRASVVTVPAAFGALQCDATARACALAGLDQAPLLQEPLAAAIAYGLTPGARDQRWMVFDLGGGTLDIAVVSTRDGRLTVLEHRGNNLLGGKDIDRKIAQNRFVPALSSSFLLPNAKSDSVAYQRLMRRLAMKAEEAKIDLSSLDRVVVSLIDLGEDANGKPIELEVTLTRAELEREMELLLDGALRLAEEALAGARIVGKDLDRILLVGGPTQSPIVRSAIASRLGSTIDFSIDPMTVVARGAALFAATIERDEPTPARANGEAPARDMSAQEKLLLVFEPVSAKLTTTVGGKLLGAGGRVAEIKIDTESGYWSSGWVPLAARAFEMDVMLQEGKSSRFFVYARDAAGTLAEIAPGEFSIRHGLVVAAPPLPSTIGLEVTPSNGKAQLDPIFKRGTQLPAQREVRYRSDKACRPGDDATSLAIKLWEGEELAEAESNVWVGLVKINAAELRRPLPENSEIELTIKIDASRLITIEAFIPYLNQHFTNKVYVAQEQEQDFTDLSAAVPDELDAYRDRLTKLEETLPEDEADRPRRQQEVERLRRELNELDNEAAASGGAIAEDPDRAKRVVEASRSVRTKLSHLERASGVDPELNRELGAVRWSREAAQNVVERFGGPLEKKEFQMLEKQLERALEKGNEKSMPKIREALDSLRWRVLYAQDWYWREAFDALQQPGRPFVSRTEVEKLLLEGRDAIRAGNSVRLRAAVTELWKLQPKDEVEQAQERAMRSGLRRF
jgi:molecular chaperone DnaK